MLKKIWQKSPYFFLSACFFLPSLSYGDVQNPHHEARTSPKEKPEPDLIAKDSPLGKMNIFAQMTGVWGKPSKKMDVKIKSKLPVLTWHSEQGGDMVLSLSSKSPIGSAQKALVQISGDFFSCGGESLRLWFSTQEYIDLTPPVCDKNNVLNQQSSTKDEEKLAVITNHGGLPVLLSQGNLGVIVRSQLAPKEVRDINWYRMVTNPKVNKDLMGEGK
ncbi:hypothetical protein FAI41_00850 [Acetobacteraceae bacterium]|nr:hypothetical protein FAI41_00850 [Acetobacteraceae bacterium]